MSKATLKIHQDAKHSNYKPFQCHLCDFRCKVKGNLDKHLRGRHKIEVMTLTKLWDKVMATGQGYSTIVHRLTSFKRKGAIGMANDGDIEKEMDQNLNEETEVLKDIVQAWPNRFAMLDTVEGGNHVTTVECGNHVTTVRERGNQMKAGGECGNYVTNIGEGSNHVTNIEGSNNVNVTAVDLVTT
ncbi:uncharacterized protein LOC117333671 [Pecten maximus]|uniref:uncharacterized protein LOC117333671 n=1 Tax=Pecten maximus TaxID=6579 RepID=UPI001458FBF2|nr:uncharacterized protein LOC117333671 [Pecten maximus]